MRQLTATDLLTLNFNLFVKETNETYEDTMQDIEHGTQYMYAADGYIIYNSGNGFILSFNWMTCSSWVGKNEPFNYSTQLLCGEPNLKLTYSGELVELINEDGSSMDEIETHNTLLSLVEDTISFEREIEKDLPTHACGDE